MQVIWSPNCTLPYLKIQDTRWNPANLIHPRDENSWNSWNLFKFGNLNLTRPASKASSPERRLVSPSASLSRWSRQVCREPFATVLWICSNKMLVLDGGVIRARQNLQSTMGCHGMPWASLAPPPLPQVLDRRCCYFHRRTPSAPASVVIAMECYGSVSGVPVSQKFKGNGFVWK